MTECVFFLWFIDRLPTFDPSWPDELCAQWLACWEHLWRWGCRLTVEEAIEAFVKEQSS